MTVNPILASFVGEPALVESSQVTRFESLANAAVASPDYAKLTAESLVASASTDTFWFPPDDWRAAYRPYVIQNGILLIPVKGILLNNFPWNFGNYATGYEYIWQAFQRGMSDPDVKGIALVCDTPGGMVAGNFSLVDRMYAMRGTKPVWGFAHESAYSAGYSIISVADKIYVSRTGGVGSIGVVTMHVDMSQAVSKAGLKITFIYAGSHKVDGNPYEPLPDDVKARIQSRIDELYGVFVATVARNRPVLTEQAVIDTQAQCFTATESLSNKLADNIGDLDDSLTAFAGAVVDTSSTDSGEEDMATPANTEKTFSQADVDAARAEGIETGMATGRAEGATSERARISAILGSDEAKGREKQALYFATKTSMSPDEAKGALAEAPKVEAAAAAPANKFDDAMTDTGNPEVAAERSGSASEDADASVVSSLYATAGMVPPKKRA